MMHLPLELIQHYLRGTLPLATQAACDQHLAQCQTCREAVASEKLLSGLLRLHDDTPLADASPEMSDGAERAVQRVRDTGLMPASKSRVFLITTFASLLMILLVASFTSRTRPAAVAGSPIGLSAQAEADLAAKLDLFLTIDKFDWIESSDFDTVMTAYTVLREDVQ